LPAQKVSAFLGLVTTALAPALLETFALPLADTIGLCAAKSLQATVAVRLAPALPREDLTCWAAAAPEVDVAVAVPGEPSDAPLERTEAFAGREAVVATRCGAGAAVASLCSMPEPAAEDRPPSWLDVVLGEVGIAAQQGLALLRRAASLIDCAADTLTSTAHATGWLQRKSLTGRTGLGAVLARCEPWPAAADTASGGDGLGWAPFQLDQVSAVRLNEQLEVHARSWRLWADTRCPLQADAVERARLLR